MRLRTASALAASLLAATLATALRADDEGWRDDRYDDRYERRDDRYDDRYGDPRYERDRRPDFSRAAALAHELEAEATGIHRRFARNNRRPNRAEVQAMRALHALEESADRFHAQLENGRGVGRARQEFARLEETYWRTAQVLRTIGRRDYVERGMHRIDRMLEELQPWYGRRGRGHARPYDGHDYGRGYGEHDGRRGPERR
jgi:hypothetical protein